MPQWLTTLGDMQVCSLTTLVFLPLFSVAVQAAEWQRTESVEALRASSAWLRGLIAQSEHGFVVEPVPATLTEHERAGDGKQVTRRYRLEKRTVPVYEIEWETVEVPTLVKEPGASDGVWKMVKQQRVKNRTKVGEREVETKVYDENGPYEETYTATEWKRTEHHLLAAPHHFLASNAIAYIACRRAGMDDNDPITLKLSASLERFVTHTDLPDTTWDLAWLVQAGLHHEKPDSVQYLRPALDKLLAGAGQTAQCLGMWGPLAIDRNTLAKVIQVDQLIDSEWEKLRTAYNANKSNKVLQTRLQKATDFRYKHKNTIRNMTRQGLRYEAIDSPLMTDPGLAEDKQMSFPGLPYNFYHLELTDLETTALVLESFLLAQRRGVLPEEISAIKLPNGKAVRKALDIEKLFQGTLKTLKTMQSSDGSFDAGNRAGPVIAFNKLPEVTIPSAPALTRKLESERGDRYTIAGFRALRALNELAAKDRRAQRQMSSMLKSATKAVRDLSAQADNLPAKPAPIKARMSYLDNPSLWV